MSIIKFIMQRYTYKILSATADFKIHLPFVGVKLSWKRNLAPKAPFLVLFSTFYSRELPRLFFYATKNILLFYDG